MKIIRKDLLIDQKKIQQAYIEKEILNTVRFLQSFIRLVRASFHYELRLRVLD
jgi:hypothetical protein